MINELEIHNFKSIKDLTLPCKRFNLFIGEPNTGKSNILEALGLVSFMGARKLGLNVGLGEFVRHERLHNLFYDGVVDHGLSVRIDECKLDCTYSNDRHAIATLRGPSGTLNRIEITDQTSIVGGGPYTVQESPPAINFYRSPALKDFVESTHSFLHPPFGNNLLSLLERNRELREIIGSPYGSLGYRVWLRPLENQIDVVKATEDMVVTSFPYSLASETLQRITFYTAAIETNENAVIVLEEPEAHSFPEETKLLAERIALEENGNQYFIVTHNPYFLMPLFSKAPKNDMQINIVYSHEYRTRVRPLAQDELPELFELDIFLNTERFIES